MTTGVYLRMEKYRKKIGKYYVNLYPKIFDLCYCGCNEIVWNGNKFIHGHSNKLLENRIKNSKSHKGHKVLNETKLKISLKNSRENNGMYNKIPWNKGISPSKNTRNKIRKSLSNRLDISGKNSYRYGKAPSRGSGRSKGAYYDSPLQGKIWLRSSYEIAYAKWLDENKILWMYEMETFDLGNTTYTPDFFLPRFEKFIDTKGYMRPKSQEKINRFRNEYPWDLEILYKKDLIKLGVL